MWDLPGSEIEPMSHELVSGVLFVCFVLFFKAGRVLTTSPAGKLLLSLFWVLFLLPEDTG